MRQFLHALDRLLKRGLRFDYQQVEEDAADLRKRWIWPFRGPPGGARFDQVDGFLMDAGNRSDYQA
jgi:5-methylcytosine-specific restriction enzyme subunit McrC